VQEEAGPQRAQHWDDGGAGGEAGGARLCLKGLKRGRHHMGGAAGAAGGVQGGARRLQCAAAMGRGPAAGRMGPKPAELQEEAGP
jgi:hypothetical protein